MVFFIRRQMRLRNIGHRDDTRLVCLLLMYDLSGLLLLTFGKSGFILSIGDKIDRLPITVREYRTSLISFLFVFGFFKKT